MSYLLHRLHVILGIPRAVQLGVIPDLNHDQGHLSAGNKKHASTSGLQARPNACGICRMSRACVVLLSYWKRGCAGNKPYAPLRSQHGHPERRVPNSYANIPTDEHFRCRSTWVRHKASLLAHQGALSCSCVQEMSNPHVQ